jgi:hypothetical protein
MIRTRGRGVVYGEVWYDEVPGDTTGVDILVYRQRPTPLDDARSRPSVSLFTDLSADARTIAAAFDTTCRYHIRRAGKTDALETEFIDEPEIRLEEFRAFYDAFALQKAIWRADMDWLVAASRARQLVLSVASRDSEPLVWHAYVMSGDTAGMQYSCSCYRGRDAKYRSRVARANRWLHWRDMLQFKQRGVARYDWGGLFSDEWTPERAGINKFKRSFGPKALQRFECTRPITLRGRIWLPLRDAWRDRRPWPPDRDARSLAPHAPHGAASHLLIHACRVRQE